MVSGRAIAPAAAQLRRWSAGTSVAARAGMLGGRDTVVSMRGLACCIAMLAGCLQPSNVLQCGDREYPASQLCPDDATAGATCTIGDTAPGHCVACGSHVVCDPARCGDGVIDPELLNEQCDGAAPFAQQCADVGYDLGRLGCNVDRCEFDTRSCVKFGWKEIVEPKQIYAMWTDGTRL